MMEIGLFDDDFDFELLLLNRQVSLLLPQGEREAIKAPLRAVFLPSRRILG